MSTIDVKITQVNKQESKNLQASQLILEFKGKSVNSTLVNTIRRLCYDYVPTYAFPAELITIEKNNSVYDNDYMKCRLSQITAPNIKNNVYFLEDKYWMNIEYKDPNRLRHPDDNKVIDIYCNITNNTNENMNVTTEHIKIYEDGEELNNKFDKKYPHLLIDLRPKESFSCKLSSALSIGKISSIWSAAGNCYYEELDNDKFKFVIESQGQMDEYEILHKACRILKEKINLTKKLLDDKYDLPSLKNTNKLKLVLENEDHTLGGIINEYLQENKDIIFSGVSKPDLEINTMIIEFMSSKNNPIKPLIDTLDYIHEMFDDIENKIMKLGEKFINYKINNKTNSIIFFYFLPFCLIFLNITVDCVIV